MSDSNGRKILARFAATLAALVVALNPAQAPAGGDASLRKALDMHFARKHDQAAEIIFPLADGGNPDAQFYAGMVRLGKKETWEDGLEYLEKSADQCSPEAIEQLLHYGISREGESAAAARAAKKIGRYRECVLRSADRPGARHLLAALEMHDEGAGHSRLEALLDEDPDDLTVQELAMLQLVLSTFASREDAKPYYIAAAEKGDYLSVLRLSLDSPRNSPEEELWLGVQDWFENAMGRATWDRAKHSESEEVKRFVRDNYLSPESEFKPFYDWCMRARKSMKEEGVSPQNCLLNALDAEYECAGNALIKHAKEYRASPRYDLCRRISSAAGSGRRGGMNISWRAFAGTEPVVKKRFGGK